MIYDLAVHSTSTEKIIISEPPNAKDYSMTFFETNADGINVIGSDFISIEVFKPYETQQHFQVFLLSKFLLVK